MRKLSARHTALLVIVLLAFIVRLYKVTNQPLDWHAFRQADTASVTREYVKHGINILEPRYHDLGNIQSGLNNLEGWRMVEFPIINAGVASLLTAAPFLPLEVTHRVVSILFSIGTLLALFYLVKNISGVKTAYVAILLFAVMPYSIFYGRAILPEAPLVFFFVFSLYGFQHWLKQKSFYWYGLSLASLMLALLLKPFVLFFAPVYLAIAFSAKGWRVYKEWLLYPYAILAVLPLVWWRNWITQYPSGIPDNDWLFNSNQIRFRPSWFKWLFYERIIKMMLGFSAAVFLPIGVLKAKREELLIYGSWWFGVIAYFSVIATGNVQHDYYQYIVLPIICITVARGVVISQHWLMKRFNPLLANALVASLLVIALALSWQQVKGNFSINHHEYIVAGNAVDRLTPPDAKVIAPAFGDTLFLYQTNRTGWPIGFEIEDKIEKGAEYYITTSDDDEAKELQEKYFTIEQTPQYILIDLTKKSSSES